MSDVLTLLLVDDDETTRDLLTVLLGAEGWQVSVARDGEEALAIVKSNRVLPSVILCDLQMPGLSGPDLAQAIRESIAERAPVEQPLLLAMTATVTAGRPAWFDDLLVKPFPPDELLRRCEMQWGSQSKTDGLASADALEIPPPPDAETVIAPQIFERLRAGMPAAQLLALYDFALTDAETRLDRMGEAVASADDALFRREAHAMKGSCGMIGAQHLANLAARAEKIGPALTESKPLSEFTKGITQIRHMLERLLQD